MEIIEIRTEGKEYGGMVTLVCSKCHGVTCQFLNKFDKENGKWITRYGVGCSHCGNYVRQGAVIPYVPREYDPTQFTPPPPPPSPPKYAPKCPTCGSPSVTSVSTTSKLIGALTLGIASRSLGKTMKCKHCGYMW